VQYENLSNMKTDKNWYLLTTRENWEKKVAGNLFKKNIESFLPLNKVSRKQWDGSVSVIHVPLFPSLLFVYVDEDEISLVKQTDGFLHFMYWGAAYAVISREDIKSIIKFSMEHECMWVEKCPVILEHTLTQNLPNGAKNTTYQAEDKPVTWTFLRTLGYNLVAYAKEEELNALHHAI
jgi:transcription antitermination factor NusG